METLKDSLKQKLTAFEWENFEKLLNISKKKLSRLLNGIDHYEFYHIKVLSDILRIDPEELINTYKINNKITLDELKDLKNNYVLLIKKLKNV